MITMDRINKILDEADSVRWHTEEPKYEFAFYLCKALVYSILYAAELLSKSLRNR